jgi:hypothetical protein
MHLTTDWDTENIFESAATLENKHVVNKNLYNICAMPCDLEYKSPIH